MHILTSLDGSGYSGNIETDIIHTDILEIKLNQKVFSSEKKLLFSHHRTDRNPKVDQGERIPNKFDFAVVVDKDSKRILNEIENLEKHYKTVRRE